nr:PREDICTED: fas apoptotic inhibitory molecule 1 isoform X2 [Megachile rotundata]
MMAVVNSINKEARAGAGGTEYSENMAAILLKSLHNIELLDEPTAKWDVPLSDGNHVIEFEHGTATGRRLVKIDGKELIHRDWMFHLVGDETFTFNGNKFVIRIDPIPGLKYSYTLWVNGKSYENFIRAQSKILETWLASVGNEEYRIVLNKQTQTVWINGEEIETEVKIIPCSCLKKYGKSFVPERIYRRRRRDIVPHRRSRSFDQILQLRPERNRNNVHFIHRRHRNRERSASKRIQRRLKST